MNDQVILPKQPTSAKFSNESATKIPQILHVTNGLGEPIPDGGSTKNSNLRFHGSGPKDHWLEVWDLGLPVSMSVLVDAEGSFDFEMFNQDSGIHEYSLLEPFEQQWSAPWVINVNVAETTIIDYVTDPEGKSIEPGGSTLHNNLSFVGLGEALTQVKLLDNGVVLQTLNVDERRHWSAFVEGLSLGSHEFVAIGEHSQSGPMKIRIRKPAPISIQFVLGDESFQLIENHGSTTDRSVTLVGTANPGETGWIVDYHRDLVPFAANKHGVYFATIEDLEENRVHTFRLRSDIGRLSAPWAIRVISSKLR